MPAHRLLASVLRIGRSSLLPGLICVYTVTLSTERGDAVHTELAVVHEPDAGRGVDASRGRRRRHGGRSASSWTTREPAVRAALLVSMASHIADVASAHGYRRRGACNAASAR